MQSATTDKAAASLQRAALFGVVTSASAVVGGIVRAKVTAVALGPEGFGSSAAVLQVTGLLFVPLSLVTGPALVSALARARERGESGQRYHDSAATLVLTSGTVLALLSVIASFGVFSTQSWIFVPFTALAAIGALTDPLARVTNASLLARGDVRRYAMAMALNSTVVALVTAVATYAFGLPGQFVAIAVIPSLLVLAFVPLWRRAMPDLRLFPQFTVDREFLREAAAVGVATLLTSIAAQGALSTVRWALWQQGGAEANGQFQAAYTVGASYLGIVLQGVGTGVFPRYAAATRETLPAEVEAAARFVFDAAPPVILVAIAVREPVMHLLYTDQFDVAAQMVGYQMAADLAKALSYVYGGVLLYRGEIRAFLVTELLGAAVSAFAALALVPQFGPLGAAYGYAVTYSVYVVLTAVVLSRVCGVPIRAYWLAGVLAFTLLATSLVTAGLHWPWVRWPVLVVGLVWATQTGVFRMVVTRLQNRLAALRS